MCPGMTQLLFLNMKGAEGSRLEEKIEAVFFLLTALNFFGRLKIFRLYVIFVFGKGKDRNIGDGTCFISMS